MCRRPRHTRWKQESEVIMQELKLSYRPAIFVCVAPYREWILHGRQPPQLAHVQQQLRIKQEQQDGDGAASGGAGGGSGASEGGQQQQESQPPGATAAAAGGGDEEDEDGNEQAAADDDVEMADA